jgi:hypothetical protein
LGVTEIFWGKIMTLFLKKNHWKLEKMYDLLFSSVS